MFVYAITDVPRDTHTHTHDIYTRACAETRVKLPPPTRRLKARGLAGLIWRQSGSD